MNWIQRIFGKKHKAELQEITDIAEKVIREATPEELTEMQVIQANISQDNFDKIIEKTEQKVYHATTAEFAQIEKYKAGGYSKGYEPKIIKKLRALGEWDNE